MLVVFCIAVKHHVYFFNFFYFGRCVMDFFVGELCTVNVLIDDCGV